MIKLGSSKDKKKKENNNKKNPSHASKDNQIKQEQQQEQQLNSIQKRNGILAVQPVPKGFLRKVTSLIDTEESRAKFFEALRYYHQSRNVKRLVRDLKHVLDTDRKYALFKEIRALIPEEHLKVYDKLVKLNKRGERLIRIKKRNNEPMGFSFRGGKEHGIGFFITSVVTGSTAAQAGLKVADEIRKINGLPLYESIHSEILSILRNDRVLNLVVKNDGRVPTKIDNKITWTEVEQFEESPRESLPADDDHAIEHEVSDEPHSSLESNEINEAEATQNIKAGEQEEEGTGTQELPGAGDRYISVNVEGNDGLGCSIDTDVNGNVGVYVVSIEKPSLAEQAGLRVGDQILNVCGKDFDGVTYDEALEYLQSNTTLTIIVRYNEDVSHSLLGEEEAKLDNIKPILVKEPRTERNAKSAVFGSSVVVEYSEDDEKLDEGRNINEEDVIVPDSSNFDYPPEVLEGREVHYIAIEKDGTLGMNLECKHEKIVVYNVVSKGAVERHGFLESGDWILSCEGYDLMSIPLSQAQTIISMVMQRWSKYIEFIVACPPGRISPTLPSIKETSSIRKDIKKTNKKVTSSKAPAEKEQLYAQVKKNVKTTSAKSIQDSDKGLKIETLAFDPSEITLSSEVDNEDQSNAGTKETVQDNTRTEQIPQLEKDMEDMKVNDIPPPSLDIFSNSTSSNENTYLEAATLSRYGTPGDWNVDVSQADSQVMSSEISSDIFDDVLGTSDVKTETNIFKEIDDINDSPPPGLFQRSGSLASFFSKHKGKKKKDGDHSERKHKFKLFGGRKNRKRNSTPSTILTLDTMNNQCTSQYGGVPAQYKSDLLLMISEDEPYEHRITVEACKEEEQENVESIDVLQEDLYDDEDINAVDDVLKTELKEDSSDESVDDTSDGVETELFERKDVNIDGTPIKSTKEEDDIISSPESHQVPVVAVITEIPKRHSLTVNDIILPSTTDEKIESDVSSINDDEVNSEVNSISSQNDDDDEEAIESQTESDLNKKNDSRSRSDRDKEGSSRNGSDVDKEDASRNGSDLDKEDRSRNGSDIDKEDASRNGSDIDKEDASRNGSDIDKEDASRNGSDIDKKYGSHNEDEARDGSETNRDVESQDESDMNREDGMSMLGIRQTIQQWERRSSQSDFSDPNISEDLVKLRKKKTNRLDTLTGNTTKVRKRSSSSSDQSVRGKPGKGVDETDNQSKRSSSPIFNEDVSNQSNESMSTKNDPVAVELIDNSTPVKSMEVAVHSSESTTSSDEKSRLSDFSDEHTSDKEGLNSEEVRDSAEQISNEKDIESTDDDTLEESSDNCDYNMVHEEDKHDEMEEINAGHPFSYMEPTLPVVSTEEDSISIYSHVQQESNINESILDTTSSEMESSNDSIIDDEPRSSTSMSANSYSNSPQMTKKTPPHKPLRTSPVAKRTHHPNAQSYDSDHTSTSSEPKLAITKQSSVDVPVQKQMAEISMEASKLSQKKEASKHPQRMEGSKPYHKTEAPKPSQKMEAPKPSQKMLGNEKGKRDSLNTNSLFFGQLNEAPKKFFTEEEIAGFQSIKQKPNMFLTEAKNNPDCNDRFYMAEENEAKTQPTKTISQTNTHLYQEETHPFTPITAQEETQSFRTIDDLKSVFNDASSPPPMPKEIIKRFSGSHNTTHEPVHELGGFLTFSPKTQHQAAVKSNNVIFEHNIKVAKVDPSHELGGYLAFQPCSKIQPDVKNGSVVFENNIKAGGRKKTESEPVYETIGDTLRTPQTLTHAEVLSISQRMAKRGKVHDIVTDIISDDSSSNPSPRSPTGREVKSILLKNRKNSPKKVKFSNKVKVGTAYHADDDKALPSDNPSHPSRIGNVANPSAKGLLVQPSPAFTVQNHINDTNRSQLKHGRFIEDNRDDHDIQITNRLKESSVAMRQAAESLGIDFVGKDSSAFIKITNLDE